MSRDRGGARIRTRARTVPLGIGLRAGLALSLAMASTSCKKAPVDETAVVSSSEAPPPEAKPVDHLASDELLEGTETAIGLKLPRALSVTKRYDDEVHASGTAPLARVVAYFKSHTREAKITTRLRSATFEKAKLPEKPGTLVDVTIDNDFGDAVRVVVRDVTPPPPPPLPDEASRRKAVGLAPDGKRVLDPSHLE